VRGGGFNHQDSREEVLRDVVAEDRDVAADTDFYPGVVVQPDVFVGNYLGVVRIARTGDSVVFVTDY
jgi:hypothetical protein